MNYLISFCISFLFLSMGVNAQNLNTVSGKVIDTTGAPLIGAIVKTSDGKIGAATDDNGAFKLSLPAGTYTLVISYFGYKQQTKVVNVSSNVVLTITMQEDILDSEVILITAEAPKENVTDTKMGATEITVEEIKTLPALFGEVDIVKNIQTLPGVQVAGEGNTGLYVRGGGADQNLILIDEAPVFNASHLFGIFSVFNAFLISVKVTPNADILSGFSQSLMAYLFCPKIFTELTWFIV